jgi:hypothetical protein
MRWYRVAHGTSTPGGTIPSAAVAIKTPFMQVCLEEVPAVNDIHPVSEPPWGELDSGILDAVRAFSCIPGITTVSSCEGHPERDGDEAEWHIGWRIIAADPGAGIFESGPDPQGWTITEWLIWHVNDLAKAGFGIYRNLSVPPPFLNGPGECMTFWVHGILNAEKPMSPDEYIREVVETWGQTGYGGIPWPEELQLGAPS